MSLIVFDLDGTLIDSRRDLADAINALLVACGASALPEDDVGGMVGSGAAALVARAFAAAQRDPPPDALDRFLELYDARLLNHTRPYPRIPELLAALRPRAALAVLTNKPRRATMRILDGLDLSRYFEEDAVVGGDGPFPRKPDAAGLRHLIARAQASPSATTMVGDSVVDWHTARNASTRACLVRYGFGFDDSAIDDIGGGAVWVQRPDDLFAVL